MVLYYHSSDYDNRQGDSTMSSTSIPQPNFMFETPRDAAQAVRIATETADVGMVVRLLNNERTLDQLQWYLTHVDTNEIADSSQVDVVRTLGSIKKLLDDEHGVCKRRELGDARLALYTLLHSADLHSLETAMWVCEPYGSLPRMLHVALLYLTPTSYVS